MLDAAALAAILDPERTIEDWWHYSCPECGDYKGDHSVACFDRPDYMHKYYGPPDLHTAREHAWRMEEWLEARGYSYARESTHRRTQVTKRAYLTTVFEPRISPDMKDGMRKILAQDPNHTAALVGAIERINNEVQ